MPFSFLHRPSRKRKGNPWYENALLLAIAGSIIAVIGQLAGTLIPIMYGPQDVSDFSINIDPISSYNILPISNDDFRDVVDVHIAFEDIHPFLRPYRFKIILKMLGIPKGAYVNVPSLPTEYRAGDTTVMSINCHQNVSGYFPILIQGIGGDGRVRNATFYLSRYKKDQSGNVTTERWDLYQGYEP
jgi:hypothetical protein